MIADLLRLADEVEAMEGPSREMDRRVLACFGKAREQAGKITFGEHLRRWHTERVTASVDAALGLLAEVLPGWDCATKTWDIWSGGPYARVTPRQSDQEVDGSHAPTLPLAICAAVLRAVAAREGKAE